MEAVLKILENSFMALYVIVFIIALFKLPLYKHTPLKFLPVILFITIATEYVGYFIKYDFLRINYFVFNLYYLIHFSFFFYVFMAIIDDGRFKQYIRIGMGIFLLFFLSDLFFTGIGTDSFAKTYIAGAGILVFCIILYYINILQSYLVLVVKNDLLFWISVGLFLFYIGYIPIKIIKTWFYKPDSFFEFLLVIQFSLIIIMYLFFLTGFLWMKKR
ncbi:hypothetical protein QRD02_11655 [Aequorivita sp. SDUM287046]|uniref:Lysoplasmalogenase n=1 Tax=Aequorivita aurantiaca TaxID=3053356 RepID=A0ABT8DI15_9FLAO|nr:hypothetical protein [Aequorivita aurantiaca]MDN3725041.1 hypothetical protein [Aequorivita aurantiaca]